MMSQVGRSRIVNKEFMAWIRRQPEWRCVITGLPAEDFAHLRSRGAGGSDYWPIPLVHDHHMKSHQEPAWWYRHRVAIAEWIYQLPMLHQRYREDA